MPSNASNQDVEVLGPPQRKQEGIKRACNECRQQKLRCDVVSSPFQSCSRCRRLRLECRIDASFKRVEKRRAKHARQQLEAARLGQAQHRDSSAISPPSVTIAGEEDGSVALPAILDLPTMPTISRDSSAGLQPTGIRVSTYPTQRTRSESDASVSSGRIWSGGVRKDPSIPLAVDTVFVLDGVELNKADVDTLLKTFFTHYHPFLPFLDPSMGAEVYYRSSRLLFWAIIAVASRRYTTDLTLLPALAICVPRLMWSVLQRVTQNYYDIKALCLLCIWPFPRSSSASDPTFMLSGTLVSLSMQLGLHKPHQPQDFSQFTKQVLPNELQDRITTWAACKIVSQRVSTGYGQTLGLVLDESSSSTTLSIAMQSQLKIESLCAKISKDAFSMSETVANGSHSFTTDNLAQDLASVELELVKQNDPTLFLYLHCARLHLHLQVLHRSAESPNYLDSALSLYDSCSNLIVFVQNSETDILSYCPNYVYQVILAASFAVLRLSTSPLIECLDSNAAKKLFNSCISAVRKICITNNDLPGRLAEVLAQLKAQRNRSLKELIADWNGLQLKVRGRLSMSVSYDSLWEWRGGFVDNEHRPVTDAEALNGNEQRADCPPHEEQHTRDGESVSSIPIDQGFDLNNMSLDQLYPWMLENATDLSGFHPNLNEFTA